MVDSVNKQLVSYIERARKVLQYEQRGNHQDQIVRGGLELFVVRWADEVIAACKNAGLDPKPIHRFTEHLEGYRRQDPIQRAASLRAALAILSELEDNGAPTTPARSTTPVKVTPVQADAGGHKGPPHHSSPPSPLQGHSPAGTETQAERKDPAAVPTTADGKTAAIGRNELRPYDISHKATQNKQAVPQIQLDENMSAGHAALTLLSADVTAVPGVGPSVAGKLRSLGIRTVRDLLFYFPRQHRDYSKLEKIAHIPFDEVTTTIGMIWEVETVRSSKGLARTIATISDETGKLRVTWFNQPYLQKQLNAAKGSYLVVTGVKHRFGNKIEFNVRSYELPEQGDLLNTGRLVPIYPLTEGLNAKILRRCTKWVVDRYAAMVPEFLPASIRFAGKLMPLPEAVSQVHYPENEQALEAARLRLGFDELFLIQLGMQERRTRWQ